jgi:hypothetical protein
VMARGTEMQARPIAMKAASQDYWWGDRRGAAITMVPRSLSLRTLVACWTIRSSVEPAGSTPPSPEIPAELLNRLRRQM